MALHFQCLILKGFWMRLRFDLTGADKRFASKAAAFKLWNQRQLPLLSGSFYCHERAYTSCCCHEVSFPHCTNQAI